MKIIYLPNTQNFKIWTTFYLSNTAYVQKKEYYNVVKYLIIINILFKF